eukprot:4300192-Amphidinium_carterae.1
MVQRCRSLRKVRASGAPPCDIVQSIALLSVLLPLQVLSQWYARTMSQPRPNRNLGWEFPSPPPDRSKHSRAGVTRGGRI